MRIGCCVDQVEVIRLREKIVLFFRIARKQIQYPRKRIGSSLVPGDDEYHYFINQLLLSHRLVGIFIPRLKQHVKKVTMTSYRRAAFANDRCDYITCALCFLVVSGKLSGEA